MKKPTKRAESLLRDNHFVASANDRRLYTREVNEQLHGVHFHFHHNTLHVRVLFHYVFLESFNTLGQKAEASITPSDFQSFDFVFRAEAASFERPVQRNSWWETPWDKERNEWCDWDASFVESKTQLALNTLKIAAEKWQDPCVIMDTLTPSTFEYRAHKLGFGLKDGHDFPVARLLFAPWFADGLNLCRLAASIACRYGYWETLGAEYEQAYDDLIMSYDEARGDDGNGGVCYGDLIRLRQTPGERAQEL